MRLILVRHGETVYNAQARFTGQSDVPLSVLGRRQTAVLGECLATECLDVIVTSDLERTRALAEAIARYHALPIWEDINLRELALGEWEADPTNYAPPGGGRPSYART